VTGRALTEPGGSMVAGVEVSLAGRPGNAPRSVGIVGIGNGNVRKGPDALTTAADGSYSFNNLPPGNYMVFTRGRDPRFQPDGVWSEGVSFAIVDRNVRADDLCLKLPQSVSGTVRDADTGEPIARAQIRLRTSDLSKLSTTGPVNATIYADAQGRYRVYARSPKVDLSCDGDSFRYYGADGGSSRSVAVEPGRETTVDFRCKSSPPLAGRVLNPDGTPAKSADVRVWVIWPQRVVTARRGRAFVSFIADSEGRFHGYMRMFTGPAAPVDQGAVSIEAYAWLLDHSLGGVSRAEAPSGEPLARPLEVKLEKTGTAVVRVLLEDGTPAANAEVDALTDAEAEAGAGAIQFSVGGYILPSLQLGAPPVVYLGDGRYRITGLIPGMTWQIRAYPLKPQRAPQIRDIEVKPGQTIDAGEIRLGPEGKPAARAGQGASSGTSPRAASPPDEKPGAAPVIERVTVDLDRAVIEGRASKNDKIVSILFGSIIAHGSGDAKQGVLRG
jgi:hypothetical protein